jgi:HAD superfamily hydrolase (TIGR01509 family)
MQPGLIFDCDGVLADTELHGHLAAFNLMWQRFGVPWRWSTAQYAAKLKIGGGKERMASLFRDPDFLSAVKIPKSEEERAALILSWHKEKTAIFEEIIAGGSVPPRAGIERLSKEALSAGWRLAVASTSARPAVAAVLKLAVGELASEFSIFAGDAVRAKKPAPDVYLFAIGQLGVPASHCIAIEDSRNGLLSARAAQIPVVITVSEFTREEKFDEAQLVVTSLGDPQGQKSEVLANRMGREVGDLVDLKDLEAVIENAGVSSRTT